MNTDGKTIRKGITKVKYDVIKSRENRRLKRHMKNTFSPKRRDIEPSLPLAEGEHMKWYREEQKVHDYVQCYKLFTQFWTGEKKHPKAMKIKVYTPKDYLIVRLIQILNLDTTKFEPYDMEGLLQVVKKLKLRLYAWHLNSIKLLLNTIIEGSNHDFINLSIGIKKLLKKWNVTFDQSNMTSLRHKSMMYRPTCLRLTIKGSTKLHVRETLATHPTNTKRPCATNESRDDYFGHTHSDHKNDHMETKTDTDEHNHKHDIVRMKNKKYEQEGMNMDGRQDEKYDAIVNDTNIEHEKEYIEYMEEDLEKTDYAFPSMKEMEQRELERLKKNENSDDEGDEVKRAKADQYDLDALENYDIMESELLSKGARDDVALRQDTAVAVGQPEEENEAKIPHYDGIEEYNLQYEQNTEPIANEDQPETLKTEDEKIYNQAEEYIDKLFADIDAK